MWFFHAPPLHLRFHADCALRNWHSLILSSSLSHSPTIFGAPDDPVAPAKVRSAHVHKDGRFSCGRSVIAEVEAKNFETMFDV